MKGILEHASGRHGYDGWGLRRAGEARVYRWSICTTRQEARDLKKKRESVSPDLFRRLEVVKVKLKVEVTG